MVDAKPQDMHTITPHLMIRNAAEAIEFYKKAFGAKECARLMMPDGKHIMHAMMSIGDSPLMIAEEMPEGPGCPGWGSPQMLMGTTIGLHLYVDDVDASYKQAITAGCRSAMPPTDMFWGDRYAQVFDPFGHSWSFATHKVDLSPEEVASAAAKLFAPK